MIQTAVEIPTPDGTTDGFLEYVFHLKRISKVRRD
jgi:hypothetical protein